MHIIYYKNKLQLIEFLLDYLQKEQLKVDIYASELYGSNVSIDIPSQFVDEFLIVLKRFLNQNGSSTPTLISTSAREFPLNEIREVDHCLYSQTGIQIVFQDNKVQKEILEELNEVTSIIEDALKSGENSFLVAMKFSLVHKLLSKDEEVMIEAFYCYLDILKEFSFKYKNNNKLKEERINFGDTLIEQQQELIAYAQAVYEGLLESADFEEEWLNEYVSLMEKRNKKEDLGVQELFYMLNALRIQDEQLNFLWAILRNVEGMVTNEE